jgi:hypothetical protein
MEPGLKSTTPETAIVGVEIVDFATVDSPSIDWEAYDNATGSDETSEIFEREEPPMRRPKTVHWDLPISKTDYNLLKTGFTPHTMDDRWEMTPDYLEESSAYSLRFARSWTGIPHYVLIVRDQGPIIDSMVYESLTEGGNEITENTAKKEVIALARDWLKCEIGAFPSLEGESLFFPVDDARGAE